MKGSRYSQIISIPNIAVLLVVMFNVRLSILIVSMSRTLYLPLHIPPSPYSPPQSHLCYSHILFLSTTLIHDWALPSAFSLHYKKTVGQRGSLWNSQPMFFTFSWNIQNIIFVNQLLTHEHLDGIPIFHFTVSGAVKVRTCKYTNTNVRTSDWWASAAHEKFLQNELSEIKINVQYFSHTRLLIITVVNGLFHCLSLKIDPLWLNQHMFLWSLMRD